MRQRSRPESTTGARRTPPVRLLDVDAGLRAAVPADEVAAAARVVIAPGRIAGPGTWASAQLVAGTDVFAVLLVEGLVTREVMFAGRRSAELLGPGDVLHPWRAFESTVPTTSRWASESSALLALLDRRFLAAARHWPQLFGVIHDRLAEQLDRGSVRSAILGLPRVEQRVLGLFWHLAERWGKVRPEGVLVELALTHELIGQLVGAQRPTISLALQTLNHQNLLRRTRAGAWLLGHDSSSAFPDVRPIGPVLTAVAHAPSRSDFADGSHGAVMATTGPRRHTLR
jgi:CRP/FNR family cyclic AMP-dependent transcriptional regulator